MNTLWGPLISLWKTRRCFVRDGSVRTALVLSGFGYFGAPSRGHGWQVLQLPFVPHRSEEQGPISATLAGGGGGGGPANSFTLKLESLSQHVPLGGAGRVIEVNRLQKLSGTLFFLKPSP